MAQQSGLSFTFKRDFTPKQYLTETEGDIIEIMYFRGCWSLTAKIERLAQTMGLKHEGSRYLAKNFEFLKEVHNILMDERAAALAAIGSEDKGTINTALPLQLYYKLLEQNLHDIEWLLFYITGVIAASQLFESISDECFELSNRSDWISMCRAWGNENPDKFELIYWID